MTINQNKLNRLAISWSKLSGSIAHDLATPLAIIRMAASNSEKLLPTLLKGYHLAVNNHLLSESEVHERQVKVFEQGLTTSKNQIKEIVEFLNGLHPYNQELMRDLSEAERISIKEVINTALKKYTFSNEEERNLIHVQDIHDFKLTSSVFFIEHLFDHLLRNSLYAIHKADRGKIYLWTEETEDYNQLHFKDTAIGMRENECAQVFDRFFSKRDGKIIPGLGYCRLALQQKGGDIYCDSVHPEYTDFVLQFPKYIKS